MTPQLWQPWTVHNDRIILTGEPMPDEGTVLVGGVPLCKVTGHEWGTDTITEDHPCRCESCQGPHFSHLDLFTPHDGPVVEPSGKLLLFRDGMMGSMQLFSQPCYKGAFVTHTDLLRAFFHDLGQRPDVRLLCVTAYPELVPQSWPADVETVVRALQGKGDVTHAKLSNLTILAGPIHCQADLERLAPVMRGLRNLCRVGLWFDGQEAGLDVLRQAADFWETAKHYRREIAYSSILLTSPNQHTADVERQVEGSGVEVIRL